jgi:ferredoxin
MATLSEKLPENIPGRYYVDASCIDCDQCRALAPEIFARDDNKGVSFVVRQPATPDEITQVEDIMSTCATSSIGNDGA